ncbi:hypothetical protein [Pseudochryseolinea flava]|uniref:Uncharacterized protein n=1 Tax=Pseudochryseolinea flava TaxID=2059302 RepID=A0A364Y0V4_9BACT|nr:hypothetical protein [Pseudochryseolinea flava]RAW00442.1 hypothetical protein DQQ10_15470 [Pseudochryseolinea flava]
MKTFLLIAGSVAALITLQLLIMTGYAITSLISHKYTDEDQKRILLLLTFPGIGLLIFGSLTFFLFRKAAAKN